MQLYLIYADARADANGDEQPKTMTVCWQTVTGHMRLYSQRTL